LIGIISSGASAGITSAGQFEKISAFFAISRQSWARVATQKPP